MKKSIRILFSVLAITSTMALAEEVSVEKDSAPILDIKKFSYHGVGFKDGKVDLVAKGFECSTMSCKRQVQDTSIDVFMTDDRIQTIDARTRYNNRVDCPLNQREIRKFMTEEYNFEFVSQDRRVLGIDIVSNDVGGNIKTNGGTVFVNVSCMNDSKINMGYVNTSFNLKNISAQSFKDAFKYE